MIYSQNGGYGQAIFNRINSVAASVCPTFGRIFVVMSPSDSANPNFQVLQELCATDPSGLVRFYTSLESAYAATTSNNNDVILLDGSTAHTIEAGIAWSKSRVHLVGMDGGHRQLQQGSRITTTGNPSTAYMLKVTGTRNTFRNVKWDQNSTDAAALTVVQFGGEGTLVKNASFVFSTATNLDGNETTTYEVVMGEDSGTFIDCTFGNDTLTTTGARAVMAIDRVTTGQEMKSCFFKNCLWNISSTSATAHFIRVLATTDLKFTQLFVDCNFFAGVVTSTSAVTLSEAVSSVASLAEGNMLFVRPGCNTTDFATATGNRNTRIKVVAAVSAAAAIEGIQPTA